MNKIANENVKHINFGRVKTKQRLNLEALVSGKPVYGKTPEELGADKDRLGKALELFMTLNSPALSKDFLQIIANKRKGAENHEVQSMGSKPEQV